MSQVTVVETGKPGREIWPVQKECAELGVPRGDIRIYLNPGTIFERNLLGESSIHSSTRQNWSLGKKKTRRGQERRRWWKRAPWGNLVGGRSWEHGTFSFGSPKCYQYFLTLRSIKRTKWFLNSIVVCFPYNKCPVWKLYDFCSGKI